MQSGWSIGVCDETREINRVDREWEVVGGLVEGVSVGLVVKVVPMIPLVAFLVRFGGMIWLSDKRMKDSWGFVDPLVAAAIA